MKKFVLGAALALSALTAVPASAQYIVYPAPVVVYPTPVYVYPAPIVYVPVVNCGYVYTVFGLQYVCN